MRQNSDSLKKLVFYGEVVGFALAWVVGMVLLAQTQTAEPQLVGVDGLAHAEVGLSEQ